MPELDFMIIADYVRAERGVLHMIAGGFDTIYAARVPANRNIGIGLRLRLTPLEARHSHDVEIIFQDEDGRRVTEIRGQIAPMSGTDESVPTRDVFGVVAAFNLMLPLPRYGRYSIELLVDRGQTKSIPLRVAEPKASAHG